MKWVIVRPGGLSNKTPAEMGNVVVRGEDQLFGRPSDPGAAACSVTANAVSILLTTMRPGSLPSTGQ